MLALAPANADAEDDAEALVWAPVDATTETLLHRREIVCCSSAAKARQGRSVSSFFRAAQPPAPRRRRAPSLRPAASREAFFLYRSFSRSGGRVPPQAGPRRLHLRGAGAALFVGGDGRIQRGSDFDLTSAGGSLRFEHPPGLVSAWIDDGRSAGSRSRRAPGVERGETAPQP